MPAPNTVVTCAEGCDANSLSEVSFSICSPTFQEGEYGRAFMTPLDGNQDFTPWADPVISTSVNNPVAWTNRINQTGSTAGFIRAVHIIGEKGDPEVTRTTFSLKRSRVTNRKHIVQWESDEMSPENHQFFRKISQCGLTVGLWLETLGGHLHSSDEGHHIPITADVFCEMNVTKGDGARVFWHGTFEWDALGTEMIMDTPVPDTPEPGS